jgi:hypothetical protein
MKTPKTWIDGHGRARAGHPLPPRAEYKSPDDLPLPMRQTLVQMHRQGHSVSMIARTFEIPVEWVQLYVECPPGSTAH